MKNIRRILGVLLTLAMLFTMLSAAWSVSAAGYKTGDTVLFGTFPQSEVTDTKLMGKLADVQKHWNSAGYYSGTGSWDDGKMTASDYMQYADFVYEGKAYRAIQFTKYRPSQSGGEASPTSGNGSGYATDFIYYFNFDPIEWIVLDAANGLLMSKNVLDAQPYQILVKKSGSDYKTGSSYANNYEKSSLRAYLTGPFYKAAFSQDQKAKITAKPYCWAAYNSTAATPTVTDTVTVLSYQDCQKTAYGFGSSINSDTTRVVTGYSDYARSQGLNTAILDWWLRTPDTTTGRASYVDNTGALNHAATVNLTNKGVRPVISVSEIKADTVVSLLSCQHTNGTTPFPAVAATCEKAGHTYYEICNDCSAVCKGENKVLPATGHVDKYMRSSGERGSDGWCDVCDAELTLHLDNSGSLQLSGPLQNLMDMIRKLVARVESLFTMLSKDDDKEGETEPVTETPSNSGSTTVDLSSTGNALDSFASILGTLIDSFRGISDQKSAEKEADRNDFMEYLSNWANS